MAGKDVAGNHPSQWISQFFQTCKGNGNADDRLELASGIERKIFFGVGGEKGHLVHPKNSILEYFALGGNVASNLLEGHLGVRKIKGLILPPEVNGNGGIVSGRSSAKGKGHVAKSNVKPVGTCPRLETKTNLCGCFCRRGELKPIYRNTRLLSSRTSVKLVLVFKAKVEFHVVLEGLKIVIPTTGNVMHVDGPITRRSLLARDGT